MSIELSVVSLAVAVPVAVVVTGLADLACGVLEFRTMTDQNVMIGAYLVDDGTMDTVIACATCGQHHRFTFDPDTGDDDPDGRDIPHSTYTDFVDECIAIIADECDHAE